MEKTEQQWEQEVEDEEEEEEFLKGRKSRNGGTEITSTDASFIAVINSHSDKNGDEVQFSVPVNGAEEDSSLVQKEVAEELEISSHGGFDLTQQGVGVAEVIDIRNGGFEDVEKLLRAESEDVNGSSEKCVYFDDGKGTGFTNGVSLTEQSSIGFSNPEKKPADDVLKVDPPVDEILKHNGLPVSSIRPSEVPFKDETFSSKEIESDSEAIDLDVEGVLAKQNTHDLFCPNCNSCITRRVILRKRKRTIRTSSEEAKRNKLETLIASPPDAISVDPTSEVSTRLDGNPAPEVNDDDRDEGPDIFRCLSCFSIFIPSEGGFKLFRKFGDKSKKENIQDTQQLLAVKRSWFSSIFSSSKGEVAVEQGTSQSASVRESNIGVQSTNLNEQQAEASSSIPEVTPTETFVAEPQKNGENILNSSAAPTKFEESLVDVGKKFNDATNKGIDEEETVFLSPTPVLVLGEKDMNKKVNTSFRIPPRDNEKNAGAALVTESVTVDGNKVVKLSDRDGTYHSEFSQQSTTTTKWDIYTEKPLNVDTDFLISSVEDASLLQEGRVDIGKILKDMPSNNNNADKDTIITVESEQVETTSQISQDIVGSPQTEALPCVDTPIGVVEQRDPTATNVRGYEIIKSIVYGGLIESITSLGVISSAAGADASTVNVLALGLANLIGGLFVIGHDLWEVKESQTGGASNQVSEQVDRYQELLGRRSNFTLHAVVAVLSFLIFGLLPPVIYGFSFRQINDRDLKLLAVGASAFLCIILLAVGKAYVRRPPKSYFKTVMYYVVIGTMASGASYVAGGLIMKLLEKLGLFEPSQGVSVLEPGSLNLAWASY